MIRPGHGASGPRLIHDLSIIFSENRRSSTGPMLCGSAALRQTAFEVIP
jgi:hypothetical protein